MDSRQEPILSEGANAVFVKITESASGTVLQFDLGERNPMVQNMPTRGHARSVRYDYEGVEVIVIDTKPKAVRLGRDPMSLTISAGNPKWDRPGRGILTVHCGRLMPSAVAALRKHLERDVTLRLQVDSVGYADIDQGMFDEPEPLKVEKDEDSDGEGPEESDFEPVEDADNHTAAFEDEAPDIVAPAPEVEEKPKRGRKKKAG